MRHATRYNKRDAVEADLVRTAENLGAVWQEGAPLDGWLGFRGQWYPVEIKDPSREGHKNEYRPGQKEFMRMAEQRRLPFFVWRTREDVINSLSAKVTA